MRKRGTAKIFAGLLAMIMVLSVLCVNAFAATVGEQLTSPEEGWQRIDDSSQYIKYIGDWVTTTNASGYSEGTQHHQNTIYNGIGSINFKFYGAKLRIIVHANNTCTKKAIVTIDGVSENYSNYMAVSPSSGVHQVLVYEKVELPSGVHSVTITTDGTETGDNGNNTVSLDAIDIDDDGYMVGYTQPTNLTAAPGNAAVALSWDSVEDAVSYNIKRSTNEGGPYTTIATGVTDTAYTDATATNGITYYYVVSAVTAAGESEDSNEASATPEAPPAIGNSAILEITVTTGVIKEYDVTAAELQDFLSWYDGSSSGADKAYYIFTKKNNIAPFLSRKEYLAFDKIVGFEVKEYED